jgi:NADH-quinone oxidoreductase subunit L
MYICCQKQFEKNITNKYILTNIVDLFARVNVVLAMIIDFFDRWIIDGFVRLVAFTISKIGSITKTIQLGNTQSFVTFAILGLVAILVFVFNII